MSRRTERVNDLIRDELSELLLREVRDPRLDGKLVSITHVDVTPDLFNARVFVSIMGDKTEQTQALRALNAAVAFFHRELKARLVMRRVPFLTFMEDTSIAEGARMLDILNEVRHQDEASRPSST